VEFAEIDLIFAQHRLSSSEHKGEESLFLAALMAISRQGHLCLSIEEEKIVPSLDFLLSEGEDLENFQAKVREGARSFKGDQAIASFKNLWYLQRNWVFETRVITQLKRLLQTSPSRLPSHTQTTESNLNSEQSEAVEKALYHALSLISGGPGTGKSYLVKNLVQAFFDRIDPEGDVLIAAPTGKAAAHLGTMLSSFQNDKRVRWGTLHTLLDIRSPEELNREGGMLFADLVIVDECSMIDVRLFAYLFASIGEGIRLVLLGDRDQLPPVEAGSLFADLLYVAEERKASPLSIPYTYLKKSMRSECEEILSLASAIQRRDAKEVLSKISLSEIDEQGIWRYVEDFFPSPSALIPSLQELNAQMRRFSILSCMRRGPFGVDTLNALIIKRLTQRTQEGEKLIVPILVTRNDHRLGIYNGQTGWLITTPGEEGTILLEERSLPASSISSFEYAYVLSVHKSQGSEYERALLLFPPGSELFGCEALYTAVTRVRNKLEVYGSELTIRKALERSSRKQSGLQARLLAPIF
jgi:exodeoxyribonuclease V alpha subunit